MQAILLTQFRYTIVDDEDFDALSKFDWNVIETGRVEKRYWYAVTMIEGKRVYMHRFLIPGAEVVDHRDGNGLNNLRSNLRPCSHQQNLWNAGLSSSNTSGFKGVCWDKNRKKWHASISINGRLHNLGRFETAEEAARAYDAKVRETRGEFAVMNFSD